MAELSAAGPARGGSRAASARVASLLLLVVGGSVLLGWWFGPREDAAVERWAGEIAAAAGEARMDPHLLAGLVYAESRGRPAAVSSAGARGLCQLIPATAEELAGELGVPGPPYAPADNLRMGARYLRKMLDRHDGDLDLALLSYRLGPGRVDRELERAGGRAAWFEELQDGGPSPWRYRTQILDARDRFRRRAQARGSAWPAQD